MIHFNGLNVCSRWPWQVLVFYLYTITWLRVSITNDSFLSYSKLLSVSTLCWAMLYKSMNWLIEGKSTFRFISLFIFEIRWGECCWLISYFSSWKTECNILIIHKLYLAQRFFFSQETWLISCFIIITSQNICGLQRKYKVGGIYQRIFSYVSGSKNIWPKIVYN